jgi:DNA polymerase III epsilon subunit-like protein
MVNVTKANFVEQSNDLLQHLASAAFVAIDEEMTGISIPGTGRPPKEQAPFQRYSLLKQVPERYAIIQLGICLFHPVTVTASDTTTATPTDPGLASTNGTNTSVPPPPPPGTEWQVRRYNFYMFPGGESNYNSAETREVVLNPSAVAFLNKHNMSFDLWSKQGIPFSTEEQADKVLEKYVAKQQERLAAAAAAAAHEPTVQETVRTSKVNLRRRDDIEFFSRAMGGLRDWLDAPSVTTTTRTATATMVPGMPTETTIESATTTTTTPTTDGEGATYLLPSCNSFLRRAFYESIEKEYPSLICESAGPTYPNQIRVLRLNQAEKEAREERLRRDGWEDVMINRIGMWRIFAALSAVCRGEEVPRQSVTFAESYDQVDWDWQAYNKEPSRRQIPLIVHNGFMDIMFLLTHFHSHKLPESYTDMKALVRQYFPVVYDTKVVATECSTPWKNDNTNLSNLYQKAVTENGSLQNKIAVVTACGNNDPSNQDQEHEAAYDAFMTGAIYIGLCKHIKTRHPPDATPASSNGSFSVSPAYDSDHATLKSNSNVLGDLLHLGAAHDNEQIRSRYGRNKLFQMSMFTMDLEQPTNGDPLSRGMLPDCTYRVADIDPSVSTRDIVRCVSGLTDDSGRTVNFEIVWVDDTTFLVAANYKQDEITPTEAEEGEVVADIEDDDMTAILKDHGKRILVALKVRFQKNESIISLDEHLLSFEKPAAPVKKTVMSRVWSFFGLASKKRETEETDGPEGPARKRLRVN